MADDLVSLYEAAAHALARLLPVHIAESAGAIASLDLVAAAICALVPVYRLDSGELQRASEAELAKPKRGQCALLVTRADAETAAEKLVAKYVGTKPAMPAITVERKSARAR